MPPGQRMARPGPGKGWRPTKASGRPSSRPSDAHLVLEELAERLDQLHVHALGQAADIVVRLDRDRRAAERRDALDHVGVERPLGEEIGAADLLRLGLEDVDEEPADDLPLRLGILDAGERGEKGLARVGMDERNVVVAAEKLDHLLGLAEAQEPVVDEDAGELLADRLVDEDGGDRRIDAAGKAADDPAVADLGADARDRLLAEGGHRPVAGQTGDLCARNWRAAWRRPACAPLRDGTGWRRIYGPRRRSSRTGAFSETPTTEKPLGSAVTRSPWLIHTWCRSPGRQTPS